jgi:hypothetical protein
MKKFICGGTFTLLCFLAGCQKPKCPTYMSPKEFAAYEAKRDSKGRSIRRDKSGHIKKRTTRVDKVSG